MTLHSSCQDLPIGIQTLADIITGNYIYVDKTPYIYRLVSHSKGIYFLSRPRRFGKSLLISTLEAIFLGRRELFKGLYIDSTDYDWKVFPVIRIDMSQTQKRAATLSESLLEEMKDYCRKYNLNETASTTPSGLLRYVIEELGKTQKVVVLIDEYDKPILDAITDAKKVQHQRDTLRDFYSVLKAQDANIRFVLLTGVTKFSKVSVFSGLNNLQDLTMTPIAASLCGYTQEELEFNFKDHIAALAEAEQKTIDETLEKIKLWYNGYQFSTDSSVRVYNPFSTLLLFQHKHFKAHWFETGTPTFLVELLKKKMDENLSDLESKIVDEDAFATFDVDQLNSLAILVQTGYLTIKHYNPETRRYTLDYPNFEVKESFLKSLLKGFSFSTSPSSVYTIQLQTALETRDLELLFDTLDYFFANIPYDLHIKNEKYYHSIFYLIFTILGFSIHSEIKTNKGRIDAVVETKTDIYLFEFKFNDTAENALAQIKELEYFKKYLGSSKPTTLLGVSFDTQKRGISGWVKG